MYLIIFKAEKLRINPEKSQKILSKEARYLENPYKSRSYSSNA